MLLLFKEFPQPSKPAKGARRSKTRNASVAALLWPRASRSSMLPATATRA